MILQNVKELNTKKRTSQNFEILSEITLFFGRIE